MCHWRTLLRKTSVGRRACRLDGSRCGESNVTSLPDGQHVSCDCRVNTTDVHEAAACGLAVNAAIRRPGAVDQPRGASACYTTATTSELLQAGALLQARWSF